MIKNQKPLSMAEVEMYIKDSKADNQDIINFIKKFTKLDEKEVQKIRKEIMDLNMMKIKGEHIVKIIDFLPEDASDLNKIFIDMSLDEDERKKILDIVKQYV